MDRKSATNLGSVIEINPASISKHYRYDEIEYIDISSVDTGSFNGSTRMPLVEAPSRAKRLVKHGDTILATVRPNLRSFLFIKNPPENMVVSTGFAVLHPGNEIDARFLYYTVTDQKFTDYLTANAKGSAYPAVDTETISRAEISLPTLETQQKIAAILSAYDDLIENNLRRIKILEEMAQSLYREWFVKFRFPGCQKVKMVESSMGKIPEGWDGVRVEDLYQTASGGTPSRKVPEYFDGAINWVKTQELRDCFIFETEEKISEKGLRNSSAKIFPENTVLIAMYGATIGQLAILARQSTTNQACCALIKKNPCFGHSFAFLTLKERRADLIKLRQGAAQQNVNQVVIKGFKIIKPKADVVSEFNSIADPMLDLIKNLQRRNFILRQTRDLLLPKLISGELDVSELDITIPEANA